MVLHGMFLVLPIPYPRYGLTWEFSYRCLCHIPDMVLRGDLSSRCQRHVAYMVLPGTSHNLNDANAMSQTWSYMGSLYPNVMTFCIRYIPNVSTGL
ncbi:hypothetical protein Gotur_025866, partial [Gossypium turneri]